MPHLGVGAITKLLQRRKNMALQKPRAEATKARMARERRRKETKLFKIVYKQEMQRWDRLFAGRTPTGEKFLQLLSTTRTELEFCRFRFSPKEGFVAGPRGSASQRYSRTRVTASSVFEWIFEDLSPSRHEERLTMVRSFLPALLKTVLGAFEPPHLKRLLRGGTLALTMRWNSPKPPSFKAKWVFEAQWEG